MREVDISRLLYNRLKEKIDITFVYLPQMAVNMWEINGTVDAFGELFLARNLHALIKNILEDETETDVEFKSYLESHYDKGDSVFAIIRNLKFCCDNLRMATPEESQKYVRPQWAKP